MRRNLFCRFGISLLIAMLLVPVQSASAVEVGAVLLDAPARNYVKNSAFSGPEYWILKGNGTEYRDDVGRGGDGAVHMRDPDGHTAEIVQTIGPRLEGKRRYTVTAWVRSNTPGSIAVVGVRWQGGYPRVFRGVSPEDGWSKIEFRFEAPQGEGWRQIVLSGAGDLVWDDVAMYEADTLEARLAKDWEKRLESGDNIFTGLVVNALGTPLERGMSPSIYDTTGKLVFAGIGAGESQVFSRGLVAYATDLRQATAHPRLKVSDAYPIRVPLVVDAQGTRGLPRTDVVIGEADARLIRDAVRHYDFLGRFAVVIVVEPFSGL